MKVRIPVTRLLAFAADATAKARGGITAEEGRSLAAELLDIAAPVIVGLAPPVVGSVLGAVLHEGASLLADPPATVAEGAQRVIAALAPFVGDVHLDLPDVTVDVQP